MILKCIIPTTAGCVYRVLDVTPDLGPVIFSIGTSITCADRLEAWS